MRALVILAILLVSNISKAQKQETNSVFDQWYQGTGIFANVYYPFWPGNEKKLKRAVESKSWLGVRLNSAFQIFNACGYVVVDRRIHSKVPETYPDNKASFHWGVISVQELRKTWLQSNNLFSNPVGISTSHEVYTNGEVTEVIFFDALKFLGQQGYVFDEQAQRFKPTQEPLPGCQFPSI